METKICSKCNEGKKLNDFYNKKDSKDGKASFCKDCNSKLSKEKYLKNKEVIKKRVKTYSQKNKDKIKSYQKEYYSSNKNELNNKNKIYNSKNKESIKKYIELYRKENVESIRLSNKKYRENNKEKIKISHRLCIKKRMDVDIIFKIRCLISNNIRGSFRRANHLKNSTSSNILGCSIEYFKNYIESKFESWMTWNNYGLYNGEFNFGWDLDHIIPISSATSEEDVIKLNHYTNFQPLCSYINRNEKRDNY